LTKLFNGMETVLRLTASRKRHTQLDALQQDVAGYVGRDLSTERLEKILALAGGMVEVLWIGSGRSAFLSVEQRGDESKPKAPTAEELIDRKSRFEGALAAAVDSGEIPRTSLPPRPAGIQRASSEDLPSVERIDSKAASGALAAAAALPPLAKQGSSSEARLQALRARVLARKPIFDQEAAYGAELKRLESLAYACEDSFIAHAVLAHLFARGEGHTSCATEAELLLGVTSPQCKKPLSPEAGKDAVAKLLQVGAGTWFSIDQAVFSTKAGSFLRRVPEGPRCASVTVLEKLESDLRQVYDKKRKLLSDGPSAFVVDDVRKDTITSKAAAVMTNLHPPQMRLIPNADVPGSKTEMTSDTPATATPKAQVETKANASRLKTDVKNDSRASATAKTKIDAKDDAAKTKTGAKNGRGAIDTAKAKIETKVLQKPKAKAKATAKAKAAAAAAAAVQASASRRSTRKSAGAK